MDDYVSLKIAAEKSGISYPTLRRAARLGTLATKRYSERSQVVRLADVEAWKVAHYKPDMRR